MCATIFYGSFGGLLQLILVCSTREKQRSKTAVHTVPFEYAELVGHFRAATKHLSTYLYGTYTDRCVLTMHSSHIQNA